MIDSRVFRLTILQYAVCMGSLKIVKHLLSLNANTDCSASLIGTPLCLALITGHLSVANYLCQQGIVPNEEKALCSITSRSILHYLLRYDIREIEHQPDLYRYLQTQLSAQIQITMDGITTQVKLAEVSSDRTTSPLEPQLTPLDVALRYRQVYTVMWLYKNNYYQRDPLDIAKMLNNLNIGAMTFDEEVRELKFRAQTPQTDCSLKDFAEYLPTADDVAAISIIKQALFPEIVNYILRYREEVSYFLSESIKVLCERYGMSLDLREMFEMNIDFIFASEREVYDDDPYAKLYQSIPMLYEDVIRHLLLPGKPLYHSKLPSIAINCQTDLYRLFYAYEQMQTNRPINGENSQDSTSKSLCGILHFFLDYYLNYPGTISTSILRSLFASADEAELNFISQKDSLKRNLLCKLIDYYIKSNDPMLLELITSLSKNKMALEQSDLSGSCARDRILNSNLYQLFSDKLPFFTRNNTRRIDSQFQDEACESEHKRQKFGP